MQMIVMSWCACSVLQNENKDELFLFLAQKGKMRLYLQIICFGSFLKRPENGDCCGSIIQQIRT